MTFSSASPTRSSHPLFSAKSGGQPLLITCAMIENPNLVAATGSPKSGQWRRHFEIDGDDSRFKSVMASFESNTFKFAKHHSYGRDPISNPTSPNSRFLVNHSSSKLIE
ncbi:hypothetical protein ACLOJK_040860 [Asimina triloba]